jgi:hypothetical protein
MNNSDVTARFTPAVVDFTANAVRRTSCDAGDAYYNAVPKQAVRRLARGIPL